MSKLMNWLQVRAQKGLGVDENKKHGKGHAGVKEHGDTR